MKDMIKLVADLFMSFVSGSWGADNYKQMPFPIALTIVAIGTAIIGVIIWLLIIIALNSI
jgi:hypothetical protein